MRNNKSNDLEPHFQTSATLSRWLEVTKTAAVLPHCSESTKEPIAGWRTLGLAVRLEFRAELRDIVPKNRVMVLPGFDFLAGKGPKNDFILWALQHRCITYHAIYRDIISISCDITRYDISRYRINIPNFGG